jgi:hypothetical protein
MNDARESSASDRADFIGSYRSFPCVTPIRRTLECLEKPGDSTARTIAGVWSRFRGCVRPELENYDNDANACAGRVLPLDAPLLHGGGLGTRAGSFPMSTVFIKSESENRNSLPVRMIAHPIRLHFDVLYMFEHLVVGHK